MLETHNLATKLVHRAAHAQRFLVAIAGPPGSGKSTLAEQLKTNINQLLGQPASEIVPMDGFHLDNATLDQRDLRHRKGAPDTFDASGFVQLITQLRLPDSPINIPLFDRDLDAVIPMAKAIIPQHKILLIEGNYLLLAQPPWSQLHALFDFTVYLNPGMEVLEHRLIERWINHGYDPTAAKQRALSNDIPNAKFVLEHSVPATLIL